MSVMKELLHCFPDIQELISRNIIRINTLKILKQRPFKEILICIRRTRIRSGHCGKPSKIMASVMEQRNSLEHQNKLQIKSRNGQQKETSMDSISHKAIPWKPSVSLSIMSYRNYRIVVSTGRNTQEKHYGKVCLIPIPLVCPRTIRQKEYIP